MHEGTEWLASTAQIGSLARSGAAIEARLHLRILLHPRTNCEGDPGLGRVQVPQVRPSPPLWRLAVPKLRQLCSSLGRWTSASVCWLGATWGSQSDCSPGRPPCMEFWIAFQAPAHPRVPADTSLGDEPRLVKVRTRDAPASLGGTLLLYPESPLSDREL